jgi:hypothetical protein
MVARCLLALAVPASLVAAIAGGLVRAGVSVPQGWAGTWLTPAVAAHAFLFICSFMGTVIGIERAVAVRRRIAFAAPLASALAGAAMLAGADGPARWLAATASAAFVAVNVLVVARQRATHTALLLIAALAWLAGNLAFAFAAPAATVVPWWFSFLILTIAAERLEMTRLMRRRPGASQALGAIVGAMLLGCAAGAVSPRPGAALFGSSLVALAVWLLCFDIARRTVRGAGLSRYMAVCLLLGYGWLAVAGMAWVAGALGPPWRDTALHALAIGFVFSMMLAHAPVILPAIARIKLSFGAYFYVPLALLHASLALRLLWGARDATALASGAAGNALAIVLFAVTLAGAAIAWHRRRGASAEGTHLRDINPSTHE